MTQFSVYCTFVYQTNHQTEHAEQPVNMTPTVNRTRDVRAVILFLVAVVLAKAEGQPVRTLSVKGRSLALIPFSISLSLTRLSTV